MPIRTSNATWNGNLQKGNGTMRLGSGLYEGPYTFASRFEEGKGSNPEGGNIVFLDGHQEWRNFTEMEMRYTPGGGGGAPFHWW